MNKNKKILDKISNKLYGLDYFELNNDERKEVLKVYPSEKEIKDNRFITENYRNILGKQR